MIAEGTEAASVSDEQVRQVAADAETFLKAHRISRKDVAKSIGYSAGVISEFLAGTYKGAAGQVAMDLENWLVEEEQRRSRPQTTQFVWTNVAMRIKAVASYCTDFRKIGLIYGPDTSGIGKTTALRAISQDLGPRRCSLMTIDKVDANPTGLLKKLCHAAGVQDSGSNKQRYDRVVEKWRGRSHLLLIDQIQNLRWSKEDKPFYILTDLYEATTSAQLWCGTADLVAYLNRQKEKTHDESLAQIRRRIFPCVDLMEGVKESGGGGGDLLASVDQVREMFARNKLKLTPAAARFLCELINLSDSGGVGLCVQIVEYATMLAEMSRPVPAAIDVPLLKQAMRSGFSPSRSDLVQARLQIEETPVRVAKVG